MDGRQARGRVLAQAHGDRIKQVGEDTWYAPSSREGQAGYLIHGGKCSCPDGAERCKHVVAVEIIKGALVRVEGAPIETAPPAAAPPPARPAMPKGDLTVEEQERIRVALKYQRTRSGSWEVLAKGLRYQVRSLKAIAYGALVTASVAVRLARFAGVSVDDLLAGKYPPTCPHCGQRLPPES